MCIVIARRGRLEEGGHKTPWNCSYRTSMWGLGIEPGSLGGQPVLLTAEPPPLFFWSFETESLCAVVLVVLEVYVHSNWTWLTKSHLPPLLSNAGKKGFLLLLLPCFLNFEKLWKFFIEFSIYVLTFRFCSISRFGLVMSSLKFETVKF